MLTNIVTESRKFRSPQGFVAYLRTVNEVSDHVDQGTINVETARHLEGMVARFCGGEHPEKLHLIASMLELQASLRT